MRKIGDLTKFCIVLVLLLAAALIPRCAKANNDYAPAWGANVASDIFSSVTHPKFKLQYGLDGSATDVSTSNGLPVNIVSGGSSSNGKSVVTTVRNDYSSVNVTTGAWVQLVASTSATVTELEIFDSSGQTLELGTGASSSETRKIIIYPGGNGRSPVNLPASTRVSIRAISASATSGEIDINLYGVNQ